MKRSIIVLLVCVALPLLGQGQLPERVSGLQLESPFGMDIRLGSATNNITKANELGIKWVRGIEHEYFARWNGDTVRARQLVRQHLDNGVAPLIGLFYPQKWKCDGRLGPPANMQEYIETCYKLVEGTHDLFPYYEHWNEPWVNEWAWNCGSAQEYRDMTKDIWNRVKPDFPDALLIGGGSVAYNRDILYSMNDDIGYVDGSISHAYSTPSSNILGLTAIQLELDKKFSLSQGIAGAFQTEFGTYTNMFASNGNTWVARSIAPSFLLHWLAGTYAERNVHGFWFAYGAHDTHNIQGKAGETAYKIMTQVLEGTKPVEDVYAKSKAIWGVVLEDKYSNDPRTRATIWVEGPFYGDIGNPWIPGGGNFATANLPSTEYEGTLSIANTPGLQAFDYMGNEITNLSNIAMTPWEVVYLLGDMSPEQMKTVLKDATFDLKTHIKVTALSIAGQVVKGRTIDIKLENVINKPQSGTLTLTPPANWTVSENNIRIENLLPGEQRIVSFPIDSFVVNENNKYQIAFNLAIDGKSTAQSSPWTIQAAYAPKKTIEIDGDLSDWSDVVATTMANDNYKFKVAWDEEYLYFSSQVNDNTHSPFPPFQPGFDYFAKNRFDFADKDGLFIAIDCTDDNPDNLLRDHPLYEKAIGSDVDYEFMASYAQGNVSEMLRYRAPGTNHQGYYPTNSPTTPPLMKMAMSPAGGTEGKIVFSRAGNVTTYEGAIALSAIPELHQELSYLSQDQIYYPNMAWRVNGGNAGTKFWTTESGQLEEGQYGFAPMWRSGKLTNGGRVISRWAFINGDGTELETVGNKKPYIKIESPDNLDEFREFTDIEIGVEAHDLDGTVEKVEFYANEVLIGESTIAPFSINWEQVIAGDYKLTALAYDNDNSSTVSLPVYIHVMLTDNIPPSKPGNLQAIDVTIGSAKLTWEPSTDNVGVFKYKIYQDDLTVLIDSIVGNPPVTNYEVSGLDPLTSYTFLVTAWDKWGNESEVAQVEFATPTYVPVTEVKMGFDTIRISPNQQITLSASVLPADATFKTLRWSTANKSIELSADGIAKGNYVGFATVKATNDDSGVNNTAVVEVIANGTQGLTGRYYTGKLAVQKLTRVDATVDFNWGQGSPDPSLPVDNFSVKWYGQVKPNITGSYSFQTRTDDGVRLWVDNKQLVSQWKDMGPTNFSGNINLVADSLYNIVMDYYEAGGGAEAKLSWRIPGQSAFQTIPRENLYPTFDSTLTSTSQAMISDNRADISIYPNPWNHGELIINTGNQNADKRISIRLYSMLGVLVYEENTVVPVNGILTVTDPHKILMTEGLYLITVSTDKLLHSQKILHVKQ